ncbi:MAG: hypothetical protein ACTSP4_12505, partial [Candidatus Hodarchaeales archaeon]
MPETNYVVFVDILGRPHYVGNNKKPGDYVAVDGSSVQGFKGIEDSDLRIKLRDESYKLPNGNNNYKTIYMGEVWEEEDKIRYQKDSCFILEKIIKKASDRGLTAYAAPEIEFFVLDKDSKPVDHAGYYSREGLELRERLMNSLIVSGIGTGAVHHEVAASQHELEIKHNTLLNIAAHS